MKTIEFTSTLADKMSHFVKLKQHSGSNYFNSAKLLCRFDHYLTTLSFKDKVLTRSIFQEYFKKINHLCSRGFSNHYSVLQQFSVWLNQYQTDSFVLEKQRAIDRSYSRSAYIFSMYEIEAILKNSCGMTTREEWLPGLYQTLFGLLYSTGIRIGEALSLNYTDYIKEKKLIYIRQAKFRKERYLVLSNSTASRLNNYAVSYKKAKLPPSDESPLFLNTRTRRLTYNSAYLAFTKTLKKAGINKNSNGPRLHDFRHTFAVHRLLQWYKGQQNVNAKLPLLSTYMGHVDITSTQIYLESASELLQAGNERFANFFVTHIKK